MRFSLLPTSAWTTTTIPVFQVRVLPPPSTLSAAQTRCSRPVSLPPDPLACLRAVRFSPPVAIGLAVDIASHHHHALGASQRPSRIAHAARHRRPAPLNHSLTTGARLWYPVSTRLTCESSRHTTTLEGHAAQYQRAPTQHGVSATTQDAGASAVVSSTPAPCLMEPDAKAKRRIARNPFPTAMPCVDFRHSLTRSLLVKRSASVVV
jgi:hypothetical protein